MIIIVLFYYQKIQCNVMTVRNHLCCVYYYFIVQQFHICWKYHICPYLCFTERATGSSLPSEDWALNMEICDIINSSEEGCVRVCVICLHQEQADPLEVTCL